MAGLDVSNHPLNEALVVGRCWGHSCRGCRHEANTVKIAVCRGGGGR